MPAEKYHKGYLEKQLAAEIREQLRVDGHDPTRIPTYDYLNAKGFETRGLNQAIKRHYGEDMTLQKFLRQHDFGYQGDSDWPTTHEETIRLLNSYRESRKNRNDDREPTISTMESALREVLRTVQDLHDTDNLLRFTRYESAQEEYKRNEEVEELLDTIKAEKSGGAADNYIRYLEDFYEYASLRVRVDKNSVKQVKRQYDFDTTPESEAQPLGDKKIRTLWEVLKQLPERQDLSPSVEHLATRHGLKEWQIQMMVLITLGIGVGPRSQEYIRSQCREHWVLDENPYIQFPVRKNLPGQVPVLTHPEFLEAYIEYMETTREDWNGKPFPSPDSESGSRSANTLNNWLAALCEEAEVWLEDGTYPTLQNLRQTWHNQYHKILRKNNVQLQLVADEQGTKNEQHVKISYRTDDEERKSIRALAIRDFEELLPLSELPDAMSDAIDEQQYFDRQSDLNDF